MAEKHNSFADVLSRNLWRQQESPEQTPRPSPRVPWIQDNLRRITPATASKALPSSSIDGGSGTIVTPEMPEIRGCFRSSKPPSESIVTLSITSPPLVVMVRKLLPCLSPYVNIKGPVFVITVTTRSLLFTGLKGLIIRSKNVCPGTVIVTSLISPSLASRSDCPPVPNNVSVVDEN